MNTRGKLTHSFAAKAVAMVLLTISCILTVLCVLGAIAMWDDAIWNEGVYGRSYEEVLGDAYSNIGYADVRQVAFDVLYGDSGYAQFLAGRSNAEFQVVDAEGKEVWSSREDFDSFAAENPAYRFTYMYICYENGSGSTDYYPSRTNGFRAYEFQENTGGSQEAVLAVNMVVPQQLTLSDEYSQAAWLTQLLFNLRYGIYAILAGSLLLAVACFLFLLCAAGHHRGEEGVRGSLLTKLPLDLSAAALLLLVFVAIELAMEASYGSSLVFAVAAAAVVLAAGIPLLMSWLMDLAVRIKLGKWWRNTLVFRVLHFLVRLWRRFRQLCRAAFANLPLVWKTAVCLAGLTVAEFIVILIAAAMWEVGVVLFFWVIEKMLLVPAVLSLALMLRRLQAGGQALAAGDLSYQIDSSRMFGDFKEHANDLNSIALGMNKAVEERLKSERFKTELITNVSHDIKTPLTSIINYSDLIGREPCDNPTIHEYAQVLLRQSTRLKKLLEDLMDASKASTGNLEVLLAPCEAGVLLTQTAGEYEQRLEQCGLTLIVKQPEESVRIMADGRHIARVFDNLMNNICKYALSGTRVYLTLEHRDGQAVFSFKNTSRSALDIPSDELMERFVRGDSSRSTEGSGLGLSIARSLTELQGGEMELTVDGDLFKVVLRFGAI